MVKGDKFLEGIKTLIAVFEFCMSNVIFSVAYFVCMSVRNTLHTV